VLGCLKLMRLEGTPLLTCAIELRPVSKALELNELRAELDSDVALRRLLLLAE
jgi:hypothetical protein